MAGSALIKSDPEILGGKPIVAGTRISVELILTRIAEGRSVEDIIAEYPHLKREQVVAAIEFARAAIAKPAQAAD